MASFNNYPMRLHFLDIQLHVFSKNWLRAINNIKWKNQSSFNNLTSETYNKVVKTEVLKFLNLNLLHYAVMSFEENQ